MRLFIFSIALLTANSQSHSADDGYPLWRCGGAYTNSEEAARTPGCVKTDIRVQVMPGSKPASSLTGDNGDWTYVAASAEGGRFFVNATSIRRQGQYLKAWTRDVYAKDLRVGSVSGPASRSVSKLVFFKCDTHESAVKQQVFYKGASTSSPVVHTWSTEEFGLRFQDEVPGSVGDSVLAFVCGKS